MSQDHLVKFFIMLTVTLTFTESIKVCRNFIDYYVPFSLNCYNNPDTDGNVTAIVDRWGYKLEQFEITTDDGYQLALYKIRSNNKQNSPVLLSHGLINNCLSFINRGNKSLAHIFLRHGFDVWLANFRGSRFSRGHTNLTNTDPKYWAFSFHEMATKDLPAIINTVSVDANQKKIIYVGFSMGSLIGYIYAIVHPTEAKNLLSGIISLAPTAYFFNIGLIRILSQAVTTLIKPYIDYILSSEIRPTPIIPYICGLDPMLMVMCTMAVGTISGFDVRQIDPQTYPVSVIQNLDSTSIQTFIHFSQLITSLKLQYYDHNLIANRFLYNQDHPPQYNLSRILVPMIMFVGRNDKLSLPENAERLYNDLHLDVQCGFNVIKHDTFSHNDYIFAKDVVPLLYNDVVLAASNLQNQICLKNVTSI